MNDGSTDCSNAICNNYAKKDERIQIIQQENRGSVGARKTGVLSDIAQNSKYIVFCDSGDTMPCDALETLYNVDCVCVKYDENY